MYSDAFDLVETVKITANTPINIEGWNSICFKAVQNDTPITEDLKISVSEEESGVYLPLTNNSLKGIIKDKENQSEVVDGLSLNTEEKKAKSIIKRLFLNTQGYDSSTGEYNKKGAKFIKVISAFDDMQFILARPKNGYSI